VASWGIDGDGNHRGFFDEDGAGGGSEDVLDEAGEIGFVTDDGDGFEFAIGLEFFEGDFGVHAAGEPGLDDGSGATFFGEDFGGFLGSENGTGEDEVGDEVVGLEELSDLAGLSLSFWDEGADEIAAGEAMGVGGGVTD